MKKLLLFCLLVFSLIQAECQPLKVYYYYTPFYHKEIGSYLEMYMSFLGKSLAFRKNENAKYQATVEITIIFSQEGIIKQFKKYNLSSPETSADTITPNFVDLQRVVLAPGKYDLELKMKDLKNEKASDFVMKDTVVLEFNPKEIEFSGLEFVESYSPSAKESALSKNGYDLVPYISDYFPANMKTFSFYNEIYNTDIVFGENQEFLLKYYIENVNGMYILPMYSKIKKQKSAGLIPLLGSFTIDNLPSGNYNFVVEVRNRENKLMAVKKTFFQRNNPELTAGKIDIKNINVEHSFIENVTNKDSLIEFINCLQPIWSPSDFDYAANAIHSDSIVYMQRFIYAFWKARNPAEPEAEWRKYKDQVNYVNHRYKTQIKKGYQTDMGRVYLQYGAPDDVISKPHLSYFYAYEMWHYYSSGKQRNIKFVFYCPESTAKEYSLLHSTAKNEIYNDLWYEQLYYGQSSTRASFNNTNSRSSEHRVSNYDPIYKEVLEDYQK